MCVTIAAPCVLADQTPASIAEFFEGRTVAVKLDMPGSQQGVDIYPQRPQALDTKSYGNRMREFGPSLRNGDSAIVTKVKVKDNNVEFHLAGGGYGKAGDDTDVSVHFSPLPKSDREKDLEKQLSGEKDNDRRRSLQRELDDIRSSRERHDRHEREMAEQAAESKRQIIMTRRMQGGSRFNIHLEQSKTGEAVTTQSIMEALSAYVDFPSQSFGNAGGRTQANPPSVLTPPPPVPSTPQEAPAEQSLKKGLTREQVDRILGAPGEVQESEQNGLKMANCVYLTPDSSIKANFVNGVLVQYNISSR